MRPKRHALQADVAPRLQWWRAWILGRCGLEPTIVNNKKRTTPAGRRAAFLFPRASWLIRAGSYGSRGETKTSRMERRRLCSVDPRHAVARLLQAMKRADANKDQKGADCRDGWINRAWPVLAGRKYVCYCMSSRNPGAEILQFT